MVKFGKLYREKQLVEFKDNYIDYKKLKRKIKELKEFFLHYQQDHYLTILLKIYYK